MYLGLGGKKRGIVIGNIRTGCRKFPGMVWNRFLSLILHEVLNADTELVPGTDVLRWSVSNLSTTQCYVIVSLFCLLLQVLLVS